MRSGFIAADPGVSAARTEDSRARPGRRGAAAIVAGSHTPTRQTESSPKGGKLKILAEILAVCVFGTLAFTATSHAATAKVTDPRVCTIKGTAGAPVYCASRAAKAAVKAKMIARTHNPRWNLTVICNAEVVSQPLHQNCGFRSVRLRQSWGATVTFVHSAAGWTARVTIKGPVPG